MNYPRYHQVKKTGLEGDLVGGGSAAHCSANGFSESRRSSSEVCSGLRNSTADHYLTMVLISVHGESLERSSAIHISRASDIWVEGATSLEANRFSPSQRWLSIDNDPFHLLATATALAFSTPQTWRFKIPSYEIPITPLHSTLIDMTSITTQKTF